MDRSSLESEVFGFEFYRKKFDISDLNSLELLNNLRFRKCDVLRAKIFGSDKDVFSFLNSLKIPYEVYNINYVNSLKLESFRMFKVPENIGYREIKDPKHDESFQNVLNQVLDSDTGVEYSGEISDSIMTTELRAKLARRFYQSEHYQTTSEPYYATLTVDGNDAGVFLGAFNNDAYEGSLFGLLPEHRGKGLAKYCYSFMADKSRQLGIKYFRNEVNLFNLKSQKSVNSHSAQTPNYYFNISLFPFFNVKDKFKEIKLKSMDLKGVLVYISELCRNQTIERVLNDLKSNRTESNLKPMFMHRKLLNNRTLFVVHFMLNNKILYSSYVFTSN